MIFFKKGMTNLFYPRHLSKADGPLDCGALTSLVKNYVFPAEVSWRRSISDKF